MKPKIPTPQDFNKDLLSNVPQEVINIWVKHMKFKWDGFQTIVSIEEITRDICMSLKVNEEEAIKMKYLNAHFLFSGSGWDIDEHGYYENNKYIKQIYIFKKA